MKTAEAVAALAALAQGSRLEVFRRLVRQGPEGLPAGRIAEAVGIPNATLSFHLAQLGYARLVTSARRGRSIFYAANYRTIETLLGFLMTCCCRDAADGASARSKCRVSSVDKRKKGERGR
jgi:DNA-binding transcriptional ArsR family regulator